MPVQETLAEQLRDIFVEVLDANADEVEMDVNLTAFQLDDLDLATLSEAICVQFCCDFSADDIEEAETFGDLVRAVAARAGH